MSQQSRQEHLEWIKRKSERTRQRFDMQMLGRSRGSFSDFEEPVTVKTNTNSSQPAEQGKNKNTGKIDIPSKTKGERVQ